jgi:hypothetical protein
LGRFPYGNVKNRGAWSTIEKFKLAFINLKFSGLQIFNSEGRSRKFLSGKLELLHTQYMGLCDHNSIGVKNEMFAKIPF